MSREMDEKARFGELMEAYAGPIRRLCARTWLYRIAHNVALTWQARDRRRQSRETPLENDVEGGRHMDLRRLALKRAIAAMNPADRTLTLLWLEGLSAAEIEEVTGVKSATVAVRLSRIRKQLTPVEVMP